VARRRRRRRCNDTDSVDTAEAGEGTEK